MADRKVPEVPLETYPCKDHPSVCGWAQKKKVQDNLLVYVHFKCVYPHCWYGYKEMNHE